MANTRFKKGHTLNKKTGQNRPCFSCGENNYVKKYRLDKKNYCNRECYRKSLIGTIPWNKGIPMSKDARKKSSIRSKGRTFNTGRTHFQKGFTPWNKEISGYNTSRKGKKATPEARRNMSKAHTGKPLFHRRGENSNFWKGGKTKERQVAYNSLEYKLWRTAVFTRDEYTCQLCKEVGGNLNADHIKPWSLYPELRYAIDNGRTLCFECHRGTESYLNPHMKKENYLYG